MFSIIIPPNNAFNEAFHPRPLNPIGPPRLTPDCSTQRAGQLIVDLSDAAPQTQKSSSDIDGSGEPLVPLSVDPVTFLFKFEELYSHNVSYEWVVSRHDLILYLYKNACAL